MADVIDLAKARQERTLHISGVAYCMACDHEWTGAWPLGVTELECPECKSMKGRSKFTVSPPPDSMAFTCACKNQHFLLLDGRIHCPNCGNQYNYADLG